MVHPHWRTFKLENLSQIFTCFRVTFIPASSSFSLFQKSCLFRLLLGCLINHPGFQLLTLSCRSESSNKSLV